LEGESCEVFDGTVSNLPGKTEENHVRIDVSPAETRTRYFPNTSPERYRYISLLWL